MLDMLGSSRQTSTEFRTKEGIFFEMGKCRDNDDINARSDIDSDSENSDADSPEFEVTWSDANHEEFHLDYTDCANASEQVTVNFFDNDANEALHLFRVARVYVTRKPHEIVRHRRMRGMSNVCRGTLVKLVDAMVERLCSVLFPCDGRDHYSAYCAMKETERKLANRMVNLLRKLRRGSVEKRVVRACLFSCMQGRDLHDMMMDNGDVMESLTGENVDGDGQGNVQVTASAANTGITEENVGNGHEVGPHGNIESTGRKYRSAGFQRVRTESSNDWITLVMTGAMEKEKRGRRHFDDDMLIRLLSFLLRGDKVILLTWGTKRVLYGGERRLFPAVITKTSIEGLWRRYNE